MASATRLRFPDEDPSAERIRQFSLSLQPLIDFERPDRSLLYLKPTASVPHAGGEKFAPSSAEAAALLTWIRSEKKSTPSAGVVAVKAKASGLRRLTGAQYDNTILELTSDATRHSLRLPSEDFVNGFRNQTAGQGLSPLFLEQVAKAASQAAKNARRLGTLEKLLPCPATKVNVACAEAFAANTGRRAFRRPLTATEVALFRDLTLSRPNALDGAELALETMLQSPAFLFHTERGSHRIASRLSYFLWDSPPDEDLARAADLGNLRGAADVEGQARRLLADPRSRRSFRQFASQWLRLDRLSAAVREPRLFPEYNVELTSAMMEETGRLFEDLAWNDRSFLEFFTTRTTFLNASLAKLYDVPEPATPFAKVSFAQDSPRAGILGHASILTLTSKPEETSPTERGLFIREHFLCQGVPPPPPGVDATLPAIQEEKPMGNRERLAVHLSNASCAGCHKLVDPIGFGFERFDAIGRYREKQTVIVFPSVDSKGRNTRRQGVPIAVDVDTTASIAGIPNSTFRTPAEAGEILANQPICQKCIVRQLFRYALGRMESEADEAHIDAIFERFRATGFRFRELVVALVTSPVFLEEFAE